MWSHSPVVRAMGFSHVSRLAGRGDLQGICGVRAGQRRNVNGVDLRIGDQGGRVIVPAATPWRRRSPPPGRRCGASRPPGANPPLFEAGPALHFRDVAAAQDAPANFSAARIVVRVLPWPSSRAAGQPRSSILILVPFDSLAGPSFRAERRAAAAALPGPRWPRARGVDAFAQFAGSSTSACSPS